jgi:hypothetical protein
VARRPGGTVAPVDGSTDWIAAGRSDDALRWTVETVSNASAHLVGAATYTGWPGYWPGASGPFAKPMNEIPKVVFSDSLTSADWDEATIAAGDLAESVTRPISTTLFSRGAVAPVFAAHRGAR